MIAGADAAVLGSAYSDDHIVYTSTTGGMEEPSLAGSACEHTTLQRLPPSDLSCA